MWKLHASELRSAAGFERIFVGVAQGTVRANRGRAVSDPVPDNIETDLRY